MAQRKTSSGISSLVCQPRWATPRRPERFSFGFRLERIAQELGQPLMPWQRLVAAVGCEILPESGLPAYNEVIVTVPRQSGKTTLFFSWQIDRSLNWGRPQRSIFTAQTGKDARDKWLDELFPQIEASPLKATIAPRGINRGMGNEALKFRTGSLIRILSTSAASGHSKTIDQAVLDEIWHDSDDRREQGLRPAMITRADRQLLICSTAGTAASTVYNRKVELGRAAVAEDRGEGVAYFEWSAPKDWDPADQDSWWEFMPALGHTILPASIETERQGMRDGEFRRAYGNQPTGSGDILIPAELWAAVCSDRAQPAGALRFGVDVAEDRGSAAIAAFGGGVLELIEHRPGTGWVADRCNELTKAHGGKVALDFGGPAGVLADSIRKADRLKSQEVVRACGGFFDAIADATITVRRDSALDAAVEGAVKKPVGDAWVFSRRASSEDVTPLMAAALAFRESRRGTARAVSLADIPDEDEEEEGE